jgi:hypothetical protein
MFRRHAFSSELERSLARYLDLRVQELERQGRDEVARRQRDHVRQEVGRMITWMVLLAVYALILGGLSRNLLLASILNPQELGGRASAALAGVGVVTEAVPDLFRGLVLSGFSALVLLILRSASYSVRRDVGGALYVGVVVLALVAFSAAASGGPLGALAALPGIAAAGLILFEFSVMLRRLGGGGAPGRLNRLLEAVRPDRSRALAVLFVAVPVACLGVAELGYATSGGPLYWPTYVSYRVFVAWCLWACAATPSEVRIPLWSTVLWAVVFLIQLGATSVTLIFATAVVLVLTANVVVVTLGAGPRPVTARAPS